MIYPPLPHSSLTRRQWLARSGASLIGAGLGAVALPSHAQNPAPISVVQIADISATHQDVSRDFVTGSRAAWQETNAQGGIKGQPVQHIVMEVTDARDSVNQAWLTAMRNPSCIAFSGCVADTTAATVAQLQASSGALALAHVAPWLHRPWADTDNSVFPIFPNYQAQIRHAVKSLAAMGIRNAGIAFASALLQKQLGASITLAAEAEGLHFRTIDNTAPIQAPPPILLFVGGTPELHAFAQRVAQPKGGQCYVVALADVNLQVLAQLGGMPRNVSIIATQPVPLVSAGMPIVRSYRAALAKLYDEPPSPQGLAGYIAARYTADILSGLTAPLTRANVLAALRKRNNAEVGGYRIAYDGQQLTSAHANVTQSMLAADGRIVG